MKIGDLVNNSDRNRLYCASGFYPHAVVMSVDPLILVSQGADMRWDRVHSSEVQTVGKASLWAALKCLRRLNRRETIKWIGQTFSSHNLRISD